MESPMSPPAQPAPRFDPNARFVDKETGLEYEDFAAKLLGDSIPDTKSRRNSCIGHCRKQHYPEHAIRAYWQAYDACETVEDTDRGDYGSEDMQRHNAGVSAGQATGCWGPAAFKEAIDRVTFDVISGFRPRFDPVNFGVIKVDACNVC